eukprot:7468834-Pyramimonas_sp.AAC.1
MVARPPTKKSNPTGPSRNDARTSCPDQGCGEACAGIKGWVMLRTPRRGWMEEESEEQDDEEEE